MAEPRAGALRRLLAAALAVGFATALGVYLFEHLVAGAEWLAHGWHAEDWSAVRLPALFLVPVAGGLLVGTILQAAGVPEEPGHGVTEVIEAVTLDHEEFPHHKVPVKAAVAALSLGSGAALGPEDPVVEIGGAIGETCGRAARLSHSSVRALVAAGAVGGVTAAFAAPLAAVLFAFEVFRIRPWSRTALAVVAAAAAAYGLDLLIAPGPPFALPQYALATREGLLLALAVGLVVGPCAAAQIRVAYFFEHRFHNWRTPPRWLKPALGGVALAGIGYLLPEVLGVGYATLETMVRGERTLLGLLLVMAFAKMLLVGVSFGSGFLGGFFAPSFLIGALLGAALAAAAALLLPGSGSEPGAAAVLGMAAMLAAAVHAPLTAVFVTCAIAGDYALLPFLAVACTTAYAIARLLEHRSLYTYRVEEDVGERI